MDTINKVDKKCFWDLDRKSRNRMHMLSNLVASYGGLFTFSLDQQHLHCKLCSAELLLPPETEQIMDVVRKHIATVEHCNRHKMDEQKWNQTLGRSIANGMFATTATSGVMKCMTCGSQIVDSLTMLKLHLQTQKHQLALLEYHEYDGGGGVGINGDATQTTPESSSPPPPLSSSSSSLSSTPKKKTYSKSVGEMKLVSKQENSGKKLCISSRLYDRVQRSDCLCFIKVENECMIYCRVCNHGMRLQSYQLKAHLISKFHIARVSNHSTHKYHRVFERSEQRTNNMNNQQQDDDYDDHNDHYDIGKDNLEVMNSSKDNNINKEETVKIINGFSFIIINEDDNNANVNNNGDHDCYGGDNNDGDQITNDNGYILDIEQDHELMHALMKQKRCIDQQEQQYQRSKMNESKNASNNRKKTKIIVNDDDDHGYYGNHHHHQENIDESSTSMQTTPSQPSPPTLLLCSTIDDGQPSLTLHTTTATTITDDGISDDDDGMIIEEIIFEEHIEQEQQLPPPPPPPNVNDDEHNINHLDVTTSSSSFTAAITKNDTNIVNIATPTTLALTTDDGGSEVGGADNSNTTLVSFTNGDITSALLTLLSIQQPPLPAPLPSLPSLEQNYSGLYFISNDDTTNKTPTATTTTTPTPTPSPTSTCTTKSRSICKKAKVTTTTSTSTLTSTTTRRSKRLNKKMK